MKKTESNYFMDSSAWLAYFFNATKQVTAIVDAPCTVMTSVLSIFEVKRKLLREKTSPEKIAAVLSFVRKRSMLVKIDDWVCEEGAAMSVRHRLSAIDALLYTSARENDCVLVTGDSDFKGLDGVLLIT